MARTDGVLRRWWAPAAAIAFGLAVAWPAQARPPRAVAVSGGDGHTCALLSGGRVVCWGSNDHGQLGNGATTLAVTPVAVRGLGQATAISANGYNSCVLLSAGTVECWGGAPLGDGKRARSLTPVAVTGVSNAVAISDGGDHGCALISGGTVRCWGNNLTGGLGDGTRTDSLSPVPVSGLTDAVAVSAVDGHTCAIVAGGGVECWGWDGELGPGSLADDYTTPTVVPGVANAVAVDATPDDSCAVIADGSVACWGVDSLYDMGMPGQAGIANPVTVRGLSNVTAFTAGRYHSCALLSTGTVECRSNYNYWDQTGTGTQANVFRPVTVHSLSGVTALGAGTVHTCAVRSSGGIECWGGDSQGQLGNGRGQLRATPVSVKWSPPVPVFGAAFIRSVGFGHPHPLNISYGGADPLFKAFNLHWRHWGAAMATAFGTAWYLPPGARSVSQGHIARQEVVAFDLGLCKGKFAYLKMKWFFPGHGGTFRNTPANHICGP